jgi:hypothetical protein
MNNIDKLFRELKFPLTNERMNPKSSLGKSDEKKVKNLNKDSLVYKDYRKNLQKKYRKKNKLKVQARKKVFVLVRNGTLKKLPCLVCGEIKSEAHHTDYTKPLNVIWLCKKHHVEADIKLRNINNPIEKEESWVCMCNDGLGKILTPDIEKCEDCGTEKAFHLSHIL